MGTINHYAKPEKDKYSYKKKFQFGFSKDVYCHCVIHADTQEEADKIAEKIFNDGYDNKDWYCDCSVAEYPSVKELDK